MVVAVVVVVEWCAGDCARESRMRMMAITMMTYDLVLHTSRPARIHAACAVCARCRNSGRASPSAEAAEALVRARVAVTWPEAAIGRASPSAAALLRADANMWPIMWPDAPSPCRQAEYLVRAHAAELYVAQRGQASLCCLWAAASLPSGSAKPILNQANIAGIAGASATVFMMVHR